MDNYNNNEKQDQSIDLSGAFDSAVEQKQQMVYTNAVGQKSKGKNKKKIYIILIVISWAIILSIVFSTLSKNASRKKQTEQMRQEIELKVKQHANTQN